MADFIAHRYHVFIGPTLFDVISQVNESLKIGAKPIGGICISMAPSQTFAQAMAIPISRIPPKVSEVSEPLPV